MEGRLVKGQIGVIAGGGPLASGAECSPEIYEIACPEAALTKWSPSVWPDVGREIARNGFALVCGGLGGVMEAACRGAKPKVTSWSEAGGITIGLLPASYKGDANPYCDLVIPTDLGYARFRDCHGPQAEGGPLASGKAPCGDQDLGAGGEGTHGGRGAHISHDAFRYASVMPFPNIYRDVLRGNAGRSRRWPLGQWPWPKGHLRFGQKVATLCMVFLLLVSVGCRHTTEGGPLARDVGRGQRGVYHIVKRHQTFWRICKTYNVDMEEVARINGIKDKTKIKVGQRIFIPGATRVLKVDIYVEDVTAGGRTTDVQYEKGRFIWPVEGQVTATFSANGTAGKRRHDGIDISALTGTMVRAADSGKVVYSDNKMRGYGNLIIVEHRDHFFSIYAHNEENLVKEEALVKQGDVIARVGQTGIATGSHLHFEIRKGSNPLDPMRFLP